MGVKLLGKIKVHELAKELDLTSKDIITKAEELGIEVKNHLSSLEEDAIEKIKKALSNKVASKEEKNNKAEKSDKQKEDKKSQAPVIIRREVIISDNEQAKKKEEKPKENRNANIGFVERKQNKDFNIVYRNKPNKPMTVNELFGIKSKKEEKEEVVEQKEQTVEPQQTQQPVVQREQKTFDSREQRRPCNGYKR